MKPSVLCQTGAQDATLPPTTSHLPPTTHHVSHRTAAVLGEWSFEGAAELTASLLQVMSGTRLCCSMADPLFEIVPRPARRSRHGSCLATSRLLPVPPGRASTPPLPFGWASVCCFWSLWCLCYHALHTVSKRLLRRHLWGSEAGRPFYLLLQMSPSRRRCYKRCVKKVCPPLHAEHVRASAVN
jgi:hypothetical protein